MRKQLFLFLLVASIAQAQTPLTPQQTLERRLREFGRGGGDPQQVIILYMGQQNGLLPETVQEIVRQVNDTRTDQQIGASSTTAGSTTLVDRPGVPELLAVAIERGAVARNIAGSVLTLSTTPYLIAGFFGVEDTPQNWEEWWFLRRVGLSASFADDSAVETKGDFSSVQSAETKIVLIGNRSARDAVLFRSPAVTEQIRKIAKGDADASGLCAPAVAGLSVNTFRDALLRWRDTATDKTPAAVRERLDAMAIPPVTDPAAKAQLAQCVAAWTASENNATASVAEIAALTQQFLALDKKNNFSVSFSWHRDTTSSDYSTVKLLYGYAANSKLTVNLNGEGNFNNDRLPASGVKLDRIRSYAIELGGTVGRFKQKHLDMTFGTKLWRDEKTGGDTAVSASWKSNLYLTSALQVPISLTYANRDVETLKKGVQINAGVGSLVDHLLSGFMKP